MHQKTNSKNNTLTLGLLLLAVILIPLLVAFLQKPQEIRQRAQAVDSTMFSVTVYLHGIGNSGDRLNPNNSGLSNKSPSHPLRKIDVSVFDAANRLVQKTTGFANLNDNLGAYSGSIDMGNTLKAGKYTIKISSPGYLKKSVPNNIQINPKTTVKLAPVTLVAGDLNDDNAINVLDYNILMGCYSDLFQPTFCNFERQTLSDLSNDGSVNALDVNLFLREVGVQRGD